MSCNFFNVQAPNPKPNPQTIVYVSYYAHCQTLTNLQNEKMCSKLAICKKKIINPFPKTPISNRPNQHHTQGYFFWVEQACTAIHFDTL
jgi:hypothetical protein